MQINFFKKYNLDYFKLIYIKALYELKCWIIIFFQKILFKNNQKPKKILIHRVSAFGDSIVSLPAIYMISQHYKDSIVDIYSTNCQGINISNIPIDKSIVNNINIYSKKEFKKAIFDAKKNSYDLYIELPQNLTLYKSIRNMLVVRFIVGIKSAYGWDKGRIKTFMHIQKKYNLIDREIDRFKNNLIRNGVKYSKVFFPLCISKKAKDKASKFLINNKKDNIAFLIGGKVSSKKWDNYNWIKLSKKIENNYNIYLIGGNDEVNEANTIAENSNNCINLCGKLSIEETAAFLQNMSFSIGLDTGAMHLSYAVDCPVIALMSTRDLTNKWFPYGYKNIVIEKIVKCSFCLKRDCNNNICMKNITVEEVVEKINIMVKNKKGKL